MIDASRRAAPLALVLVALAACGSDAPVPQERFGVLNDEFPLRLRGWDGEAFTLETPPVRVLPLNASAVDALGALSQPERVVALPATASEYSTFDSRREDWLALPHYAEISATTILGFEPDLVIGHEWQAASAAPYLRGGAVPLLILPMPLSYEDMREELRVIGAVLDERAKVTTLLADLDRRRDALRAGAEARAKLRVLAYSNYGTGGWAAGSSTTLDLVIELAGMRNAAREAQLENFQEIDYELLLRLDPDLILVEVEPGGEVGPTEALLRGEAVLAGLSSLQNDGLARLPRRLSATTSFHMVEAAEELAHLADAWLERKP